MASHDLISPPLRLHQLHSPGLSPDVERPSTLPLLLQTAVFLPRAGRVDYDTTWTRLPHTIDSSERQGCMNPLKAPGVSLWLVWSSQLTK